MAAGIQPNLPHFHSLRSEVQALVASAVDDGMDFLNDMSAEGSECLTISNLKGQSQIMLINILDPEHGIINLPQGIIDAIDEYVEQKIGFKVIY
jgi:hypothetical protein